MPFSFKSYKLQINIYIIIIQNDKKFIEIVY